MPAFDWPLRARIVGGYADVVDVVSFDKEVDSGRCTVARCQSRFPRQGVPAQDTFPQEAAMASAVSGTQFLALRVRAERATGVYGVAVAAGRWHEECINVPFAEQWHWRRDGWWDNDALRETQLAFVTRTDEPHDVRVE